MAISGKQRMRLMESLANQIQERFDKLGKLGFTVTDSYSTICIFDDLDKSEGPEGKVVRTLH